MRDRLRTTGDAQSREKVRRAPRSRVRRVVLIVVSVLLVLVVLDRVGEVIAARKLAASIQSAEHLSHRPHVTIAGFPFLTQVFSGKYGTVRLSAVGPITEDGVRVDQAKATLHGVKVNLSEALHGTVRDVPVQSGSGSALITYPALDSLLKRYTDSVGGISVTGTRTPGHAVAHGPLGLSLPFAASITSGKLRVVPDAAALRALPTVIRAPLNGVLGAPIALPPFPFNIHLTTGRLQPDGVQLDATAHDSLFPVR